VKALTDHSAQLVAETAERNPKDDVMEDA
jgi:hypothetical protein